MPNSCAKNDFYKKYFLEISQETVTVDKLLFEIMSSRRLLADHVELLENSNLDCEYFNTVKSERFTFLRALGITFIAAVPLNVTSKCWTLARYIGSVLAGSYSICYCIKLVNIARRKCLENDVKDLINTIEKIDSSIRKSISYFREKQFLHHTSKQKEKWEPKILKSCIESILMIISRLHASVKQLEGIPLPLHIESVYQPLEELTECSLFQKDVDHFKADEIKDLYNIFLYFQSQLLTRLCLLILFTRESAFKFLRNDVSIIRKKIGNEVGKVTESINLLDDTRLLRDKLNLLAETESLSIPTYYTVTLSKIKRSSLDLLSRLIALTKEYQSIDDAMQSITYNPEPSKDQKNKLTDIASKMRQIQQSLSESQNDHLLLLLSYDAFLFKSFDVKSEKVFINKAEHPVKNENAEAEAHKDDESSTTISENNEYFAFRDSSEEYSSDDEDDTGDQKSGRKKYNYLDDELENLDLKINKRYFAPVLKQLKTKIDPIKDEMNQRERKYLMSKGVDPEKITKFNRKQINADVTSSSHSDSDSDISRPKVPRSKKNYDEMRSFLQQKQQFSLLPSSGDASLPTITGSEEILE